ncbi:MAG: polysaccharide deacetylase family protein [Nitrososphaerota archaeon]|nr:polysaccharide deacetylase family protein [Candidatus Bathyarchaeota archaeon]MDW8048220.1 polysaccharide deacetylase family protein [Nitrososphaerota archaeon]
MSGKGYIILEHDDADANVFSNAFLPFKHRFSIMVTAAYVKVGSENVSSNLLLSRSVRNRKGACSISELRMMLASGRVDLQNHSMSHTNLSYLTCEDSHLDCLEREVLGASEWIEREFGVKPVAFTPPFLQYLDWQEKYFNEWFRYWVGSLHADLDRWIRYLNDYPPPQKLRALYLSDEVIEAHGWAYVDEMMAYLMYNERLAVILMHGVDENASSSRGRDISRRNYYTLISKLNRVGLEDRLIRYSDLP